MKIRIEKPNKQKETTKRTATEVSGPIPRGNFRKEFEEQARLFRDMLTIGETPEREGAFPKYTVEGKTLKYPFRNDGTPREQAIPDLLERVKSVKESLNLSKQGEKDTEEVAYKKEESKYEKLNLSNKEAYDQLISRLRLLSYSQYMAQLERLSTSKELSATFQSGFEEFAEIEVSKETIELPVASLLPTQNSINLKGAIEGILTGKYPIDQYFSNVVDLETPLITFNNMFIIDGHHRWVQIAIFNPKAKVKCINFKSPILTPIQFLKVIQGLLFVEEGEVERQRKKEGIDLYKNSLIKVKEYISSKLNDSVKYALAKRLQLDNDDVVEYLIANATSIKYNNLPAIASPNREKMPSLLDKTDILEEIKEIPQMTLAEEMIKVGRRKNKEEQFKKAKQNTVPVEEASAIERANRQETSTKGAISQMLAATKQQGNIFYDVFN